MTLVAFQDIDDVTQLGFYSIVKTLEGAENTHRGELTDLTHVDGQRHILLRSSFVALQECSCKLIRSKVAIITLVPEERKISRSLYGHYMQSTDSLEHIEAEVKSAIKQAESASDFQRCPFCQVSRLSQTADFLMPPLEPAELR